MEKDIVKEFGIGSITLWLVCLTELSESDFGEMYRLCGSERREKIDRIKPETKKKQSVCAGYLVYLLRRRFAISREPVSLDGGKPVFPGGEGVCFNISHSGSFVVLAFGERELGVDIECVKRANLKVAERFFTGREYACLMECEEAERADVFCRIWTGKEAVGKAVGCGLSLTPGSFSVLEDRVELSGGTYELHRQRVEAGGEILWICTAQLADGGPGAV